MADYQARYKHAFYAGRDRTYSQTLNDLVDQGLLARTIDEHRTRFYYVLTSSGEEALAGFHG